MRYLMIALIIVCLGIWANAFRMLEKRFNTRHFEDNSKNYGVYRQICANISDGLALTAGLIGVVAIVSTVWQFLN